MLYNLLAAAGSNTLCSHIPIKQAVADLLKAWIHQNKWLRHHYSTIYNPLMGLRVGAMQCILQSASILLEGAISLEWELPFSGKQVQSCMVRKGAGVLACEGIRATCGLQKTMGTMTRLWQSLRLIGQGTDGCPTLCLSFSLRSIRNFLPSPTLLSKINLVEGGRYLKEIEKWNWEEDHMILSGNRAQAELFSDTRDEVLASVKFKAASFPSLSPSFICGSVLARMLMCPLFSCLPLPASQRFDSTLLFTWFKASL